jgi:hypothetical protein
MSNSGVELRINQVLYFSPIIAGFSQFIPSSLSISEIPVKNIIDNLANGEFVVILFNKHKGTDGKGKYQVYGYEGGLRQTEGPRDPYSEETDGGWLVKLQEIAPSSGIFIWDTDEATTDAAIASLKTPQP